VLRIEQVYAGKKESFRGQRAAGKSGRGRTRTGVHPSSFRSHGTRLKAALWYRGWPRRSRWRQSLRAIVMGGLGAGHPSRSLLCETITHALFSKEVARVRRIVLQLAPKAGDEHARVVGLLKAARAPNLPQQVAMGQDLTRVLD
jgi:hypothetical protein